MKKIFDTPVETEGGALVGPWRSPRQMLDQQSYDGHASIHDDATAQKLGFKAATIEGPTHFSQFDPLCVALWGERWFAKGCISAHFRTPVFEGEEVRAILREGAEPAQAAITMQKRDGAEVLSGTVSIGPDHPPSALEQRLATLAPPEQPVLLRDVRVGMSTGRIAVSMGMDSKMGDLYPFTLREKLGRITEPSPLYDAAIPLEMVSVLLNHVMHAEPFPVRGPSVGLFADQEIRMLRGPLRVGAPYELTREIVALSGSRRTESMWIRTRVYAPGGDAPLAEMLLNIASLKASYANYDEEFRELYGAAPQG
jgi:hypothetical protein